MADPIAQLVQELLRRRMLEQARQQGAANISPVMPGGYVRGQEAAPPVQGQALAPAEGPPGANAQLGWGTAAPFNYAAQQLAQREADRQVALLEAQDAARAAARRVPIARTRTGMGDFHNPRADPHGQSPIPGQGLTDRGTSRRSAPIRLSLDAPGPGRFGPGNVVNTPWGPAQQLPFFPGRRRPLPPHWWEGGTPYVRRVGGKY